MQGVEIPFGAVSKVGAFKGVCFKAKESRNRTRYLTLEESSPAPYRCDRSHPCHFKGYLSGPEKGGANRSPSGELSGRVALREEAKVYL